MVFLEQVRDHPDNGFRMNSARKAVDIQREEVRCPTCDADGPLLLLDDLVDVEDGVPGTYAISRCPACGLVFLSLRPTIESLPRCYPEQYHVQDASRRGIVSRVLYGIRTWLRRRRIVAAAGGRFESLLEIGCGDASFLRHLATHCPAAVALCGIDLQAPPIEEGRLRVARGEFEKADFGRFFDVVVLFNVLEHLHDPATSLRHIQSLMTPGGILCGEVPNWDSLWRRRFPRHWQGLQIPRHMTFFTPDSLRRMLVATGFEDARIRGGFDPGDLAVTLCNWITDRLGLATPPRQAWFYLPVVVATAPVVWLVRLVSGNSGCIEFKAARRP